MLGMDDGTQVSFAYLLGNEEKRQILTSILLNDFMMQVEMELRSK